MVNRHMGAIGQPRDSMSPDRVRQRRAPPMTMALVLSRPVAQAEQTQIIVLA